MIVLIVDDSPVMRVIIKRLLCQAGLNQLEVYEAGSGAEGLELLELLELERMKVDLIVCDLLMPKMNGVEFLSQLRERGLAPDALRVMCCVSEGDNDEAEALQMGARACIRKPFTAERIKAIVLPLL